MGKKVAAVARRAIAIAAGAKSLQNALNEARKNVHRITWRDDRDNVIDITEVKHGEIPKHRKPVKPSTRRFDFIFDGWYPIPAPAIDDITYRAKFLEKDKRKNAIVFGFYDHVTKENTRFVTYYDDEYFSTPSTDYNDSLTTFALALALSTGKKCLEPKENADYVVSLLTDIGCSEILVNDYYFSGKKSMDDIGVAVGVKRDEVPIVFVAIKGSHYGAEFGGNLLMGTEEANAGKHVGFTAARDRVLEFVSHAISELGLNGRVKMLTTGYSRGAAVSNLVASAYTDMIHDGTLEENAGVTMEVGDLYGFCFEAPLCQHDTDNRVDRYPNIVCISDPNDPVTMVPPRLYGFTVYGRVIELPSNDRLAVTRMTRYMDRYFGKGISSFYNIPRYVPVNDLATLGEMNQTVVDKLVTTFGDRDRYVDILEDDLSYTVYAILDNLDEARRAMASLDPENMNIAEFVSLLVSKEAFVDGISKYVQDFNVVTNTDTKKMTSLVSKVYDLLKRFKPEDTILLLQILKRNRKLMFTPHYPLGPMSYLLVKDPNYRLLNPGQKTK